MWFNNAEKKNINIDPVSQDYRKIKWKILDLLQTFKDIFMKKELQRMFF